MFGDRLLREYAELAMCAISCTMIDPSVPHSASVIPSVPSLALCMTSQSLLLIQ